MAKTIAAVAATEDEPAAVEAETGIAPDPIQATVFLNNGASHLIADRAEIVAGIEGSSDWITLTRVNGSTITVARSAIVAYE